MIKYPPGYEPQLGKRTPEEILAELDRRTGHFQGEVRSIPIDQASPPPEEEKPPSYKYAKGQPSKPMQGFIGACGKNRKAKFERG